MAEILSLTECNYSSEKQEIVLSFTGLETRQVERHKFFPCFYLPKSIDLLALKDLSKAFSKTKVRVVECTNSFKVNAINFDILKQFAELIQASFNEQVFLLSPERQFLVENEMSYYDEFLFFEEKIMKENFTQCPETYIDLFDTPLKHGVGTLLQVDESAGKRVLQGLIKSNALCLPLEQIPRNDFELNERYFENLLFKNQLSLIVKKPKEKENEFSSPRGIFTQLEEIDFSESWLDLLDKKGFIGFETINCNCCAPLTFNETNLSLNSLVKTKILTNDFYFESKLNDFANKFHSENENKEKRNDFKKQNYLNAVPVGPLNKNAFFWLPIIDVIELEKQDFVEANEFEFKGNWFCLKQKSFLASEVEKMNKEILRCKSHLTNLKLFLNANKNDLIVFSEIQVNPDYCFFNELIYFKEFLKRNFVKHLLNEKSIAFNQEIASALNAMQVNALIDFRKELSQQGSKLIASNNFTAFIKQDKKLDLEKASLSQMLKKPKLVQKWPEIRFS